MFTEIIKHMTIRQLEEKIDQLEKRIKVLENTRVIVYPQPYTGPYHQPQPTLPTYPTWPWNSNITFC